MIGGHVYVVGITDNPVKIGSARSLKNRLIALQIGCPDDLLLFHDEPVIHSMGVAERAVHQALAEHHRRGEWFNINAVDAIAVVRRIVPAIVAQESFRRRGSNRILERVSAVTALQPSVEDALKWYSRASGAVMPQDRKLIAHANDAIFRNAGVKAWMAFKLFMIDGREPDMERDLRTARLMRIQLGLAFNRLAEWYSHDLPVLALGPHPKIDPQLTAAFREERRRARFERADIARERTATISAA